MSEAAPAPAPKVDPETLAIRTKPARAIRFRRGVIIAIAAMGSVSLMAVAWIALKPRVFSAVADRQELSEPSNRPSTDALNGLPATYGDAPKLGPPLPGDLGRPILESQRRMATETGGVTSDPSAQLAAQERERQLAELKAARESGVLVQGRTAPSPTATADTSAAPAPTASESSAPALDPDRDPNGQARKAQFVGTLDRAGDVNPHTLTASPSPYLLSAGSVISASLITGLRSDLPGLVTAQVISQVFDSPTGRILLIPQGSRLIGSYDSVVAFGQKRALIVWQRIILPDGSSLRIDNVPASDASGYAGLQDKVDFHSWALLKGVALSTLLGVGSELTVTGESDLVQAIRESTQQNVSRAGDQLTSRNLDIQPTITIRPGASVLLVVHKDLILAPWRG
ncbi:TrbI/VirB10 family protein [Sphingobium sp. CAP-1]|uniref:TrbI/VirB10 family protein n=1 Tax=Sphingobium sp. CAP-1 TaxID=2676077 RepID=UPI0012BB3AF6|nr:TrbI/VirB10 family protein [Sphingobium sp. CAP-1]QGP79376.1 conjugal transfer protein TrbI [Sphingobium sp. CAP-1]